MEFMTLDKSVNQVNYDNEANFSIFVYIFNTYT